MGCLLSSHGHSLSHILDALPPKLQHFANQAQASIRLDLDEVGDFSERWLITTHDETLVAKSDGTLLKRIPLASVMKAFSSGVVGGGTIVVETTDGSQVLGRYSAGLAKKVTLYTKALSAISEGKPLPIISERDLPASCPNCGRPLPDGSTVCPVCVDKGKVLSRLVAYGKPYWKQMATVVGLLLVATIFQLVPPYLTKVLVDKVLQPRHFGTLLLWVVLAMLGTNILQGLMQTFRGYLGVWFGSRIMGDIRRDVYNALMRLSLSYFDKRQTSQFIGRVNQDAQAMLDFLTNGVIMITGQIMTLIAIIIVMLKLNWLLAVLAFLMTPILVLMSFTVWPFVRNRWYRNWRARNRLNILVGDALQGIRVVKAFGQEPVERDRYEDANQNMILTTVKNDGMWQGIAPLFQFVTGLGGILVWYFGGREVLHQQITLGTLMAFTSYLGMLYGPLQWFSQLINWVTNAFASADRVFEIIDTEPEVRDARNAVDIERIDGHVQMRDVTFGYEKHIPVVQDLNLTVEPGEMIGLVGHSGAGKSTFINLICRFYDPDSGVIEIDGIDLKNIRQEDLHRQIGVVLQETFLFDGTVWENIAYANPDATPAQVIRAAKIANAHDFIMRFPDGYDTKVGERGQRLSGGEKQRIAIARAVLHDPRILILDEATASLDTETERQIQEAIARLVRGRTTFAIAHRLSTLRNATRLVVLDKGRIVEVGTHEELMEIEGGVYHRLVDAQRQLSQIKGVDG